MLNYSQSSGIMKRDGIVIAQGYAGNGLGLFNPTLDNVPFVGPLPCGRYTLRKVPESELGPIVFKLVPDGSNEMHKRSEFYLHWDNGQHNFSASKGCIVLLCDWMFYRLNEGDSLTVTQ